MDIQRLREIFDKEGSFAIVVGQGYGLDEMAASLSLYLAFQASGKGISIVSEKQPLVEVSNLVGIDKVKPRFESTSGDLVVSFPYQEDEIGKVSYTLEGGFLNIIVKPKDSPLSFGEKDVVFQRSSETPTVLITIGVKRLSELSQLFRIEELKDTTIVNIDKGGANEGFGDIVLIGQGASSVSEQIANLLLTLSYPLDQDIAQNLMSGIISSTGNFQSPRTSSLAFEMAGILLRNGARRENIRSQQPPLQPRNFGVQPRGQQMFGAQRSPQQQAQDPLMSVRSNLQSLRQQNSQQARSISPQPVRSDSPQAIREFPREQTRSASSGQDAPPDWLAPTIYKGSTNVE